MPYPDDPAALTDEQWARFVFVRANPKGPFTERWSHAAGLPAVVHRRPRHPDPPVPRRTVARLVPASRPHPGGDPVTRIDGSHRLDGYGRPSTAAAP